MKFASSAPAYTLGVNNTVIAGEALFRVQTNHLANALLMNDYDPLVEVSSHGFFTYSNLVFPPGSLISGSFLMLHVGAMLHLGPFMNAEDIDIYFKCKEDAVQFAKNNGITNIKFDSPMCAYSTHYGEKLNLIYGIEYDSPANLISKFDIRACSMACDPNLNEIYVVRDAIRDMTLKEICFNPVPRAVSVRRLAKYIEKGFKIEDPYQRLFFAELIRSNIYSTELELFTGY